MVPDCRMRNRDESAPPSRDPVRDTPCPSPPLSEISNLLGSGTLYTATTMESVGKSNSVYSVYPPTLHAYTNGLPDRCNLANANTLWVRFLQKVEPGGHTLGTQFQEALPD